MLHGLLASPDCYQRSRDIAYCRQHLWMYYKVRGCPRDCPGELAFTIVPKTGHMGKLRSDLRVLFWREIAQRVRPRARQSSCTPCDRCCDCSALAWHCLAWQGTTPSRNTILIGLRTPQCPDTTQLTSLTSSMMATKRVPQPWAARSSCHQCPRSAMATQPWLVSSGWEAALPPDITVQATSLQSTWGRLASTTCRRHGMA